MVTVATPPESSKTESTPTDAATLEPEPDVEPVSTAQDSGKAPATADVNEAESVPEEKPTVEPGPSVAPAEDSASSEPAPLSAKVN